MSILYDIVPCREFPDGIVISCENGEDNIYNILVTRYYISTGWISEDINLWFSKRKEIFLKYTLKSVGNMKKKPFKWYIFIENDHKEKIEFLCDLNIDYIEIVCFDSKIDNFNNCVSGVINYFFEKLDVNNQVVVTCTRIDNDDALHSDFFYYVTEISKLFKTAETVSFINGIQYDKFSERAYVYNFSNNHFLTSIHRSVCKGNHCYSMDHTYIQESNNVQNITTTKPMWVEIIHGGNVANKCISQLPLDKNSYILNSFGINSSSVYTDKKMIKDKMDLLKLSARPMKRNSFFDVYAELMMDLKVKKMLEIGVYQGGSLRFWKKFLGDDAKIFGVDIDPQCSVYSSDATQIFIGSQADYEFLIHVAQSHGPFDLIIDDGSHKNADMKESVNILWDYVAPRGAYVVESMFTSYWDSYGGGIREGGSFVEFSKDQIDYLYGKYMTDDYKPHHSINIEQLKFNNRALESLSGITFHSCGMVVLKK